MSTLADKIFEEFREHSVSEFFRKNAAMLGYTGKIRSLTTIIHEGVTNSIDAAEEAGILPRVYVAIRNASTSPEHYRVIIEDNATGIPEEHIASVFGKMLAGTKLHRYMQQRGQQGIGVCMTGDTKVPMADGSIKRIDEIVSNDLRGKQVLTLGPDFKLRPSKIIKCWKIPAPQHLVELKLLTGKTIKLTPENPVLVFRDGQAEWVKAKDIKKGMFVGISKRLPASSSKIPRVLDIIRKEGLRVDAPETTSKFIDILIKKHGSLKKVSKQIGISYDRLRNWTRRMPNGNPRGRPTVNEFQILAKAAGENDSSRLITRVGRNGFYVNIPQTVNADLMWFVGAMAGDGHIGSPENKRWGHALFFHNKDLELLNRAERILKNVFGLRVKRYFDVRRGTFTLETSSSVVAEILRYFGVPAGNKTLTLSIPDSVSRLPNDLLAAYLRGFFDTDGGLSRRYREITFGLINKEVVECMALLLLRFGIFSRFRVNKEGHKVSYQLVVSGKENLVRFAEVIGFTSAKKQKQLQEFIQSFKGSSQNAFFFPGIQAQIRRLYRARNIPYHKIPSRVWSSFYAQGMTPGSLTAALDVLEDLNSWTDVEYLKALAEGDVAWVRVVESKLVPAQVEYVYDLTVENSHNFVANGIIVHNSGATMFAQMTSGKPVKVTTSTGSGEIVEADVMIDVTKNEGKIVSIKKRKGRWRGTRVEFEVKEVVYVRSRYGPFNYLRMTAIANPHVYIRFDEPDGVVTIFENAVTEVPKPPKPMKPHPWGMMADDLLRLAKQSKAKKITSFLASDLARVSSAKAKQVCKLAGVAENRSPGELTWEEAERLIKAFKQVKLLAPPSEGLRPIGAENIISGMRQVLKPEFVHAITRPPKVYRGGVPFLVEVGIAYGGEAGKRTAEEVGEEQGIELIRFANRAPLIFDQGACAITTAMRSVDWRRYGIDIASSPVTLFVNVVSAYVPYTSAGKQSIAEEPEIVAELRAAMMEVARELRLFLNRKIRIKEKKERAKVFERYLPIIAQKAARLARTRPPEIGKLLRKIAGELNDAGEGKQES